MIYPVAGKGESIIASVIIEVKNIWMTEQQIKTSPNMAPDFEEMLDIFLEEKTYKEFFYEDNKSKDESKRWIKKFY